MKNPFHKHHWQEIPSFIQPRVRQCSCDKVQCLLYNLQTRQTEWVDGIYGREDEEIMIFAGNFEEFHKAGELITERTTFPASKIFFATERNLKLIRNATVYFYGTWWENSVYQDDQVVGFLNRLINRA